MSSAAAPSFQWSTISIGLLAPVVSLIILLGMIGNILVIIVLWQQQRRSHRITGSYFLINLAIADIFASANLIFMLSTIINHGEWILGSTARSNHWKSSPQPAIGQRGRHQIATTLFTVIIVFIICYIPASVVNIVQMIQPGFVIPPWLDMLSFLLVVSNHANNPLIYNALNRSFRQAFREVLRLQPRGGESSGASGSGVKYPSKHNLQVSGGGTATRSPSNHCYQHSSSSCEKHSPENIESFDCLCVEKNAPAQTFQHQSSLC
ncbi:hypothetical protein OS493_025058 [Desmophyllum pertusum]|uniref:G-protein coupled receptors family 1 profile domain-containing protein n=1 Tax=Desmophyllum pertusum TaxID=174260 RepID=A0A9W9YA78_9CNID|nr:hypothetical protein OS493_025058 [Desmophyllum pertusum]